MPLEVLCLLAGGILVLSQDMQFEVAQLRARPERRVWTLMAVVFDSVNWSLREAPS